MNEFPQDPSESFVVGGWSVKSSRLPPQAEHRSRGARFGCCIEKSPPRRVLQVGNLLPGSVPDRDALREELRTAIDIVLIAHAMDAPTKRNAGSPIGRSMRSKPG